MKTENKKTAVVPGGAAAHVDLVKQLWNRGYQAVLIDYFDNLLLTAKIFFFGKLNDLV